MPIAAYLRNQGTGTVDSRVLAPTLRKYGLDRFDRPVFGFAVGANAPTFPAGTTGATAYIQSGPYIHEYFALGAGQTVTTPVLDVTSSRGLNIGMDLTATEGSSWLFGGYTGGVTSATDVATRRPLNAFIAQLDKPFFCRVKFQAADASGLNPIAFGLRKAQAHQTALGTFSDYAVIKAVVNATVADISTETRLNGGTVATVATGLTVADNVAREFYVEVNGSGVVRFAVDGVYQTASMTVDSGDVLQPCGYFIQGAATPGAVWLQEAEWGYKSERGV